MVYVDSSVLVADVLDESRRPAPAFWDETLVSSRLLTYETWAVLHARGLGNQFGEKARDRLNLVDILEMTPLVLDRALLPFPLPLRALDALHLASADWLRREGFTVEFATYDARLRQAALVMGIAVLEM